MTERLRRLRRGLLSPWTWVLLAGAVRLACLGLLPWQRGAFDHAALRQPDGARPVAGWSAALAFLERRTDFHSLTVDEHCYDEMAQNILGGRGFVLDSFWVANTPGEPTMYAGCGYPLFVASVYLVFGFGNQLPVYLVQIALQMASVWWLARAASRVAGARAGAIAGACFGFHPVAIWLAMSMMSEAVLVPATAALCWLFARRAPFGGGARGGRFRAAAIGLILAFACLTRSTCFGFVLIAAGLLIWERRAHRTWARRLAGAGLATGVFCLVCAPWTIRNYIHWHRWIPFSTKSGVNAYFFNHDGLRVEFGPKAVDGPQPIDIYDPRIQRLPDEAARDARLTEMFKEFLREKPAKFAGLCWMRFWMALLPVRITSTTRSAAVSAWYAKGLPGAALLLAAWMLVRRRLRWRRLVLRVWPWLLLVLYWQGLQTLAGPGMRYRLPVEPVWATLTGVLVSVGLSWLGRRRTAGETGPDGLMSRWRQSGRGKRA